MPQRRVLYLDSAHLSSYRIGGGKVEREGRFANDAGGHEAFSAYLKHHRRSLFMLLADVPEEGFQVEEIPHSSGKDRLAIVTRKLGQLFYGTSLTLAHSLGRLKTGRRDERLLLMALTQSKHFEPWLDILRGGEAILAGIYSLPQLLHELLPPDIPSHFLIITQTCSGLRQTFFADGKLRFSRLTPLATGTAEESAIAASSEAAKMHQYLSGQRLIDRNRPLATRILAHPAQLSAIRNRCRDSSLLHYEFDDLLQAGKRFGLHSHIPDSCGEIFFCHLLARKTPVEQFAPSVERHFYRIWQTRFWLKGVSIVMFASTLLFAAKLGLEMYGKQQAIEQLAMQTSIDQQRYAAAMQALPSIPLSTDNLRALVDRYDGVAKRAQGPAPLLVQLSRSLDAFPGIEVDQIDWKIAEQIEAAQPNSKGTGSPAAAVPPNMAGGPYAQAIVAARLPIAIVGNQRAQLAMVTDFARHLGQSPDTLVGILQQPVDTQSGKTLKSGDERGTPEAPKFSFRLTRKLTTP